MIYREHRRHEVPFMSSTTKILLVLAQNRRQFDRCVVNLSFIECCKTEDKCGRQLHPCRECCHGENLKAKSSAIVGHGDVRVSLWEPGYDLHAHLGRLDLNKIACM